jgi:membrane protease YdiL (CAAX protease family)
MDSVTTPAQDRTWPLGATITIVAVWTLALGWYAQANPQMAAMAAGGGLYAAILAGLTTRFVRQPSPNDRLRASGTTASLWAWYVVAGLTLAWGLLYGFAFGGLYGGPSISYLTPLIGDLSRWQPIRGVDGTTLLNFTSLAAVPTVILFALRVRPRELGLSVPVPGTRAATVACLVLPMLFVIWGFAQGRLTISLLSVMLVHNFLSNGFTEELMCRGLFLAPLRATVPTAWAVVAQGLLFGLIHLGGAIPEEGGDPVQALAACVALNVPMGAALGVIAVRTGSLALPTAIHIAGHIMKEVLR